MDYELVARLETCLDGWPGMADVVGCQNLMILAVEGGMHPDDAIDAFMEAAGNMGLDATDVNLFCDGAGFDRPW